MADLEQAITGGDEVTGGESALETVKEVDNSESADVTGTSSVPTGDTSAVTTDTSTVPTENINGLDSEQSLTTNEDTSADYKTQAEDWVELGSNADEKEFDPNVNAKDSIETKDASLMETEATTDDTNREKSTEGSDEKPMEQTDTLDGNDEKQSSTDETSAEANEDGTELSSKSGKSKRSKEASKYWTLVDKNRQDFTSWTQLIAIVEKEGKLESLREAYDEFLLYYPFCYGYWKKLADFVCKELGDDAAQQVYEDAVVAVGLSIDLWVAYLEFFINNVKPDEEIRALFVRAINSCGLEFKSDKLWDMYIDWEAKNDNYKQITEIYRRLLSTPTKCYSTHFDNVKEHIEKHEPWEIIAESELPEMRIRATELIASRKEEPEDKDLPPGEEETQEEEYELNLDNPELMHEKLKTAIKTVIHEDFEALVNENEKEVKARWEFEEAIKRPYFHNKPLDSAQLKNWRKYLDYEIATGGENRAIFLFERCVIACAQYEEFWLKYTSYLESLERHTDVRNVYTRACRQHLPYKASIHITWAFYEERKGDYEQALAVISNIELQTPDNMCVINHKLNLLRRHGDDLCDHFKSYMAKKTLSADSIRLLTSKYARYLLKIKGDSEKARKVLSDAIEANATHEPFYTQLLDLEYQRQPLDEEKVLSVFELINSSSLSVEVKQKFYSRRYEFIDDLGSDVNRLYTMYQEHEEAATAAKEKKRALPASDKTYVEPKKARTAQNYPNNGTAANYNQQYQQQGQYYGAQATGWNQQYYQQTADYSQYGYQQQYPQQQGYGSYTGYDYSGYY